MKIEARWLTEPGLLRVVQALEAAGGEVRAVGGCVRDTLAGRAVHEIDLATTLRPEAVTAAAQSAGLKAVPTGLAHGTITVVADHTGFEVTTLRRDVKTDGRHAEVEFTQDWREDAARRDFTMNTLSCRMDGELFDYFDGQADLAAGRVRFVGNPLHRIREDVLRILRFYRFQAYYGKGEADGAALMGCSLLAPLLPKLAAERVRTELLKLLLAVDPVPVWRLMQEGGALAALKLPLNNRDRLAFVVEQELQLDGIERPTPLRRLFAVSDPQTELADLAQALKLSKAEGSRLVAMAQPLFLPPDQKGLFRLAYRHGGQAVSDALILQGQGTKEKLVALQGWLRPDFPLSGQDVLACGIPVGPRVGEIVRAVEDWWVQRDFVPDRSACLTHLKEMTAT